MQYKYISCEKCQVHLYPSYYLINKRACLGIRDSIYHLWGDCESSSYPDSDADCAFFDLHPTLMDLWWSHQNVITVSCRFEDFKGEPCVSQLSPIYLQRSSLMCLSKPSVQLLVGQSVWGLLLNLDWCYQASHKETPQSVDFKTKHQPDLFYQDVNSH